MHSEIVSKISKQIDGGIHTEAEALYLVTEIRKLQEQLYGKDPQYAYLQFHCNWALHPELTGSKAQKILGLFEKAHHAISNGTLLEEGQYKEVKNVFHMIYFKSELDAFLDSVVTSY